MSRTKSAPAAKAGRTAAARPAARSAPAAGRGVYVQAPKSDIYVVLLGIALGSILLGCLLLGLLMNGYGFQMKPTVMNTPHAPAILLLAADFGNSGIPDTVHL
jgi:hypothetical protein